ncbi:extracellular solute-binding protein [Paenibacillus sp. strain BS8-2]
MKKKWSTVMVATLLGSSIAMGACSGNNVNNAPGEASTKPEATAAAETKPKEQTFTFLNYSNPSWPYDENWPVWGMIKEKTGVTLDVQLPSGNLLEDAISLAIASGDMPDLMWIQSKAAADKFGQQGALTNILDYLDLMPNFKAWTEKYPTELQNFLSADGKLYMTPNQGIGETNRRIWMYRQDVFNKHNLQAPTTWDEMYTVLKSLKSEYPESYPLSFRFGTRTFQDFGAAFNVPAEVEVTKASVFLDQTSGEWKYAPILDEYKTMLTYLNTFYKEELIPKDFLTLDTKMWQDIISTNRAFITLDYIGRIDFFNNALRPDNPEFNFNYMAPPAGSADGKQLTAFTQYSEEGFMISSRSKNIEEVVKYIDFFYSEEGKQLASWGQNGVTSSGGAFTEKYNDVADMRKKTGLSTDGTYIWFDYAAHISLSSPELKVAYEESPKYDGPTRVAVSFTPDEQQILSTKGDSLNSHRDENLAKFIMGTRSLNEWSSFIEEQKKLGYEEIVGIYKSAHERALAAVK